MKSSSRPDSRQTSATARRRSASPFGSKTTTTSPRRMSWATAISSARVLPTRVVPSTNVCPLRSAIGIETSRSASSTPCSAASPPTSGSGRNGLRAESQRRSRAIGHSAQTSSAARIRRTGAAGSTKRLKRAFCVSA